MSLRLLKRRQHQITVLILIISVIPLASLKAKKVERKKDLNVLLLSIDTIRADRVGYCGYDIETPHLDSLAKGGAAFLNAACQVPLTLPSHASIFTGTNPPFHGIKNNGPYYLDPEIITLAEILKSKSYSTAAFVGAFPVDSQFGLDQGFDVYDDKYNTPEYLEPHGPQRLAEEVFKTTASWLRKNHGQKFFLWVHYYDPHDPYLPPPPFDEKYRDRPYDGEIAYTDVYVGKLMALLENLNILQETLIVVVGDHGEDLYEHDEPGHGIFLYDTALKVPMIFSCPGIIPEGIEIDKQVRTIDIMPTILEMIKVKVPKFVQGKNLIPLLEGKKVKEAEESYAETYFPLIANGWSELKALRTDDWKYIQAPKPELYNLKQDPEELNNLFSVDNRVALNLKKRLAKLEQEISVPRKSPVKELDERARKKLMALGYVSGKVPEDSGKKERPDPKDRISIINEISRGVNAFRQDNLDEAERIFSAARKQDPQNPLVLRSLGNIYQKRKDWNKAIEVLEEAVKSNNTDLESYHHLAVSYFENDMIDKAVDVARIVLDLHPNYLKSLLFLSSVYKSQKQTEESLSYLEKALEVDPANSEIKLEYAEMLASNKEYQRAIETLNDMIEQEPAFEVAYLSLAVLFERTGQLDMAIETLEKARAVNISSSKMLTRLAQYLQETNQFERSVEILNLVLTEQPEDLEALNYLGINYWHSGNHDKAIDLFNKVISMDKNNASAYNNLGSVYLSTSKYDLAKQKFKEAATLDPQLGGPHNGLGVIYAKEGSREQAIQSWKKAVELDAKQYDALYNLGVLLTKMNRFEEAIKYLEQFENTAPDFKYAADIEKVKKLIARIKQAIR